MSAHGAIGRQMPGDCWAVPRPRAGGRDPPGLHRHSHASEKSPSPATRCGLPTTTTILPSRSISKRCTGCLTTAVEALDEIADLVESFARSRFGTDDLSKITEADRFLCGPEGADLSRRFQPYPKD